MSCRHRRTIDATTLKRFRLKPDAPIASQFRPDSEN
jgi:hypothetical protein